MDKNEVVGTRCFVNLEDAIIEKRKLIDNDQPDLNVIGLNVVFEG